MMSNFIKQPEYAVRLQDIEKKFGNVTAIHSVSLGFEKGKIIGLIGCNGSGKTVLMKMICGLMRPTHGTIEVMGNLVTLNKRSESPIGAIIETPGFIPEYTGYRNLKFLAGINNRASNDDVMQAIESVGLAHDANKRVSHYSLGMRERLGIAQAIMEHPEIIILDEPMNGLDRQGVADMRTMFLKLRDEGRTIILASHNALDIDVLCDAVYGIENGYISKTR